MREDGVATYDSSPHVRTFGSRSRWTCALLGVVMIAAGVLAMGDIVFATIISVKLIGLAAILVGAFEIIHAFWTKGWGGFLWQILLGILYLAFGLLLLMQPAAGALILTSLLGAVLLASGIIRCVLSFAHWQQGGWLMLVSGVIGLVAGFLIVFGFPAISVWALGFLLGVDLISHGVAWLLYALQTARRTA
ncbi:HdeD family acid-resistance protein [Bradyrhizobium sp. 44]|uniref:HdeD family acid-resistance protein n=1 Tax=Bradyrhizobium sp. 44 TaxID=2782675 RepID=UPI002111240F|nr:HdeD family acid-resistance protein [Bradyrhizobium sp. 44]MCK1286705.1 HdeD family acid-resistance protein [Bradyrhizobium sp. 44]